MSVKVAHVVTLSDDVDGANIEVTRREESSDGYEERPWSVCASGGGMVYASSADLAAFAAALRDLVTDEIWTHGRTAEDDPFLRTEP